MPDCPSDGRIGGPISVRFLGKTERLRFQPWQDATKTGLSPLAPRGRSSFCRQRPERRHRRVERASHLESVHAYRFSVNWEVGQWAIDNRAVRIPLVPLADLAQSNATVCSATGKVQKSLDAFDHESRKGREGSQSNPRSKSCVPGIHQSEQVWTFESKSILTLPRDRRGYCPSRGRRGTIGASSGAGPRGGRWMNLGEIVLTRFFTRYLACDDPRWR